MSECQVLDIYDNKTFKRIDRRAEFCVFGYIRNYQPILLEEHDNNIYYNVPSSVIDICLVFYGIEDEWDSELMSSGMSIDVENNAVFVVAGNSGEYANAYLKRLCVAPNVYH